MKPVKGLDYDLFANLESFFRLDYPCYELIFSVASETDPAISIISQLICKHPRIRARLITGQVEVGPNPKVNNLVKPYALAKYDWILISDSNIRVEPSYLDAMTAEFSEDVGIVTAVVAGRNPASLGGRLEAVFLNTFYARWMVLAGELGNPVVLGKSMLFRRSDAQRFGGIIELGRYLAEDYMAGKAMQQIGKKIHVMRTPVNQPIGRYSVKAFWARHLRWGRIRKSQTPLLFILEPFFSSSMLSGLIGSWALSSLIDKPFSYIFTVHILVWMSLDLVMMKVLRERISIMLCFSWLARELTHLGLWIHIALGQEVNWRGQSMRVTRGGTLQHRGS